MTSTRRIGREHEVALERYKAERAAEHLVSFLKWYAWPVVEPRTRYYHGRNIEAVAAHLEAVSAGEIQRLLINVPPRSLKSTLASVAWNPWEWLTAPQTRWLFASYAEKLSVRDSLKRRRVVQHPRYRKLVKTLHAIDPERYLDWELAGDQNLKTRFETTETGLSLATSVGGTATGEGGDRLVADDPHNATQAESEAVREAALEWWSGTMSTRLNDPNTGAMVIVMQRLHERDLSGYVLEQGGYVHLCLPMEYSPTHPYAWRGERVSEVVKPALEELGLAAGDWRTEEGELLLPDRVGPAAVAQLKRELGSVKAAGQLQQLPAPAEGNVFLRKWWRYYVTQEWADVHGTPADAIILPRKFDEELLSWDCAFKALDDSDYVVGQAWGRKGSFKYLLEQRRGRWTFTQTVHEVKAMAERNPGAYLKLIEDKANGTAVIDVLRGKVSGVLAVEPEGGKEARAAAVSPMVEAGDVYLPHPLMAGWVDDYINEHATFPNAAHDDQVDGTSQALLRMRFGGANAAGPSIWE
jgi:predicted phage terminase large subunit-like protein